MKLAIAIAVLMLVFAAHTGMSPWLKANKMNPHLPTQPHTLNPFSLAQTFSLYSLYLWLSLCRFPFGLTFLFAPINRSPGGANYWAAFCHLPDPGEGTDRWSGWEDQDYSRADSSERVCHQNQVGTHTHTDTDTHTHKQTYTHTNKHTYHDSTLFSWLNWGLFYLHQGLVHWAVWEGQAEGGWDLPQGPISSWSLAL